MLPIICPHHDLLPTLSTQIGDDKNFVNFTEGRNHIIQTKALLKNYFTYRCHYFYAELSKREA